MAGIYIHIPYCKSYCTYCDFYSQTNLSSVGRFAGALISEAKSRRDFFPDSDKVVRTLYLGGGTPSLMNPDDVGRLASALSQIFGFDLSASDFEFTAEVNPDDILPGYAESLAAAGVNRVSMGVQSLYDEHLKWMNRRHTAVRAIDAYKSLREAGIGNISIDLIFGFRALTEPQWIEEIERIIELRPEHISAYQMSIEPGSKLGKDYRRGEYTPPDDDTSYREYEYLRKRLAEAGYDHYEISNFTLPDFKSRHNSSYWEGVPYLGLGPAAHSYDGESRYENIADLGRYLETFGCGNFGCGNRADYSKINRRERLSERDRFNEFIMISLRKTDGADFERITSLFDKSLVERFRENLITVLKEGGVVSDGKGRIKIPPEKLFVSDGIIRDLFID